MSTSDTADSSSACRRRGRARSPARDSRLGALAVDWAMSVLIASQLITQSYGDPATSNWALLVFFLMSALTVGTIGFTPGKRLFGLRVVALETGRVSPLRALLRTVLLCLAVPALIWDRDGRGLHDRLAKTVEVRL